MAHTPGERSAVQGTSALGDEFVLDAWTSLSFKRVMGERQMAGVTWINPGWVGPKHNRRLMAYKMRHAYYENASRHFLPTTDVKVKSDHREYGDAALIVETVKAALLGQSQEIVVPGAEDWVEPEPLPDGTVPPSANGQVNVEARRASRLQDKLREWARSERFLLKLFECERNAVKLADGVYVLGWSGEKRRPRVRVYDPSFYFPVLETAGEDDFPRRVHIAWELDTDDDPTVGEGKKKVHRITWELRRIEGDVQPLILPWNDGPATYTCFMSEGVWTVGSDITDVDKFEGASVEWVISEDGTEMRDVDLRIDFIPVVHLPNTVAGEIHFGSSVIDRVLQILDDIAAADTDLHKAARLAGSPPIAVGKAHLEVDSTDPDGRRVLTYGPGTAFEVGEGTLTALDMSGHLSGLIDYVNHMLARLEVNARVPAGILGRIKPSEVPSGVALALSFGPMTSMIEEMRLVRDDKYRLLLKFVTRFLWLNGELEEEPPEAEAELQFGPFLPLDRQGVVSTVVQLLQAKAISRPTALLMLVEAGIPIEDAADEVAAIQAEDFEGALTLFDLTENPRLVAEYLGINPSDMGVTPRVPEPPQPVIPATTTPEPVEPIVEPETIT